MTTTKPHLQQTASEADALRKQLEHLTAENSARIEAAAVAAQTAAAAAREVEAEQERAVAALKVEREKAEEELQAEAAKLKAKLEKVIGQRNSYKRKAETLAKDVSRIVKKSGGRDLRDIEGVLKQRNEILAELQAMTAQKEAAVRWGRIEGIREGAYSRTFGHQISSSSPTHSAPSTPSSLATNRWKSSKRSKTPTMLRDSPSKEDPDLPCWTEQRHWSREKASEEDRPQRAWASSWSPRGNRRDRARRRRARARASEAPRRRVRGARRSGVLRSLAGPILCLDLQWVVGEGVCRCLSRVLSRSRRGDLPRYKPSQDVVAQLIVPSSHA